MSAQTSLSPSLQSRIRAELVRRGITEFGRRDFEQVPQILSEDGETVHPLHEFQLLAWESARRWIAIFAGNQAGKTVLGPWWLLREMQRRGPGDYGVIGPDHPMLRNKARPELKKVLAGLYQSSGDEWILTKAGEIAIFGAEQKAETRILFRHAQAPEAIEAFTLKGLWIDEPGQISDAVWTAIKPRVMTHKARVLMTSRPMEFNWYVREMWNAVMDDVSLARRPDAPDDIEVINYPSHANPQADSEFLAGEEARLPTAEYRMRYLGIPTRPAGAVYDCFDDRVHVYRETLVIPQEWPLYVGLDFGPDNTAAVILAGERKQLSNGKWGDMTGRFYLFREYHDGRKTAEEHVQSICEGKPGRYFAVGGNKTGEQGWRGYYSSAGLAVAEPKERLVEVGIQYVYRLIKLGRLLISKDCPKTINDLKTYAYDLDDLGNSTGKLNPATKAKFHLADAMRYVAQTLFETAVIDDPEPVKPGTHAYYMALDEMYANRTEIETDSSFESSRWDDD
jgi:hypothetical protein